MGRIQTQLFQVMTVRVDHGGHGDLNGGHGGNGGNSNEKKFSFIFYELIFSTPLFVTACDKDNQMIPRYGRAQDGDHGKHSRYYTNGQNGTNGQKGERRERMEGIEAMGEMLIDSHGPGWIFETF